MPHCFASVTDNVWAAVALVPRLFAGPARQPLVLVVLLHWLDVLSRIHILTAVWADRILLDWVLCSREQPGLQE